MLKHHVSPTNYDSFFLQVLLLQVSLIRDFVNSLWFIITDGKVEAGASSVDAVVSFMQKPGRHSPVLLSEVFRVLKAGGDFLVQEPLDAQTKATLERSLLLAGFVNTEAVQSLDGAEIVKVRKPAWDSGSVFQIKRKVVSKNGELLLY